MDGEAERLKGVVLLGVSLKCPDGIFYGGIRNAAAGCADEHKENQSKGFSV